LNSKEQARGTVEAVLASHEEAIDDRKSFGKYLGISIKKIMND